MLSENPRHTALSVLIDHLVGDCLDALHAAEQASKEIEAGNANGAIGALAVADSAFADISAVRAAITALHRSR